MSLFNLLEAAEVRLNIDDAEYNEKADLVVAITEYAIMNNADLCNTMLSTDTGWEQRMDNCNYD